MTKSIKISISSEQGVRSRQQDSYGLFRLGAWECFAVADGYGEPATPHEHLSSTVISLALMATVNLFQKDPALTMQNYTRFFKNIFSFIDSQTDTYISGSTLAIAFHDRTHDVFYTAALGDSLIIHIRPDDIDTNPNEFLHLGKEKLWGSFGDQYFAEHHKKEPECRAFKLARNDALLLCSDGLFSSHAPDLIRAEAVEYSDFVLHYGKKAHDLVEIAHATKQTNDNATAILIQT